jgi:hypothetical protein
MSAGSGVPLIRSQPKEEAAPASWQARLTHRPMKMQQETRDHSSIHPFHLKPGSKIHLYIRSRSGNSLFKMVIQI